MEIILLAAIDEHGGLGYQGKMQWQGKVPSDMRHFRALTLGHPVVMGRKTFAAMGGKPLPGRRNIVITRDIAGKHDGADCFTSAERAIVSCLESGADKVFIIGGGEIYALFMKRADTIYLTHIDGDFLADTYFPIYDPEEWQREVLNVVTPNDKDMYGMEFICLKRKLA